MAQGGNLKVVDEDELLLIVPVPPLVQWFVVGVLVLDVAGLTDPASSPDPVASSGSLESWKGDLGGYLRYPLNLNKVVEGKLEFVLVGEGKSVLSEHLLFRLRPARQLAEHSWWSYTSLFFLAVLNCRNRIPASFKVRSGKEHAFYS